MPWVQVDWLWEHVFWQQRKAENSCYQQPAIIVRYTIFGLQKLALACAPQGDSIPERENQVYTLNFNASNGGLQYFIA